MTTTRKRYGRARLLVRLGLLPLAIAAANAQAAFVADAEYNATLGLAAIKASAAYDIGITGAGSLVGVIDSGINPDHQEFAGAISTGFSFFTSSSILQDASASYHGSHVAGTIAARRDGNGMQGVAYEAGLVIAGTNFSYGQLASAINYAVTQQVDVLNNSWGQSGSTILSYDQNSIQTTYPDLLAALQNAVAHNTVVVFANGNDGYADPQLFGGLPYYFPELQRSWITVAASTMDGVYFTPYSNRCGVAVQWCVVAPGGYSGYDSGVYSADGSTTTGYKYVYGTSNATPFVSGAIALLAQRFPYMTAEQLVSVLLTTAKHGLDATLSPIYGRGEVDIGKAMNGPAAFEFTFDVDTQGYDSTWSNSIVGSGGLIKRGSGTLELTGSNSFTGGVTLMGGALRVAVDANLGSAGVGLTLDGGALQAAADFSLARAVTVNSGGGTIDTQAYQLTLTDALHGSGLLHKAGSGTLILAGSSDFTGTTQIDAGTLQTSSHNISGDIVDDATLVFDQTDAGNFAGAISGSGVVVKQGAGELQLTGSNSYSGGTVVTAGTLTGASTALQGDILNNATVVFDQAVDGSYAGAMSGSGALLKQGVGRLTLTGSNSYGGGTTIAAGTLEGDTASLQGSISGSGALVFNQGSDAAFAGVFSGLTSVEKKGSGLLSLNTLGNSAQDVTVSAGTLQIDSALTADVQVAAGARFNNFSTVTGNVGVAGGGVLASANTVAATVTGNLDMAAGSVLALALDAGGSHTLTVSGTATLAGGEVQVAASGSFPALFKQPILQAQSVSGSFDSLSIDTPDLRGSLSYGGTEVDLVLARVDAALVNEIPGGSRQQAALGLQRLLASGYYSDSLAAQVNALYAAAPAVAAQALDSLSGEVVADSTPALLGLLGNAVLAPVLSHAGSGGGAATGLLPAAWSGGPQYLNLGGGGDGAGGVWVETSSQRGSADATAQAGGYTASQRLLTAGADTAVAEGLSLGFSLTQGDLDLQREASADRADSTVNLLGGYARWRRGRVEWLGMVQGGRIETDSQRWIVVGSPARVTARHRDDVLAATLALRYDLLQTPAILRPLAALNYLHLDAPAFSESGSSLALSYGAEQHDFLNSQAGLEWHLDAALLPAGLQADVALLWQHDFSDENAYAQQAAYSVSPAASFELRPSGVARDKGVLRAGLFYAFSPTLQGRLQGQAEAGGDVSTVGLTLALNYLW